MCLLSLGAGSDAFGPAAPVIRDFMPRSSVQHKRPTVLGMRMEEVLSRAAEMDKLKSKVVAGAALLSVSVCAPQSAQAGETLSRATAGLIPPVFARSGCCHRAVVVVYHESESTACPTGVRTQIEWKVLGKDRQVVAAAAAASPETGVPVSSGVEKVKAEMKALFGSEGKGVAAVAGASCAIAATLALRTKNTKDNSPNSSVGPAVARAGSTLIAAKKSPAVASADTDLMSTLIAAKKQELKDDADRSKKMGRRPPLDRQSVTVDRSVEEEARKAVYVTVEGRMGARPTSPAPAAKPAGSNGGAAAGQEDKQEASSVLAPQAKMVLPKAKTEAVEVNRQQWGIGAPATAAVPQAKMMFPTAKIEAVEVNRRQWGIGAPATSGAPATEAEGSAPAGLQGSESDYRAKLDSIANEAKRRIDTMTFSRD
jgi:hypothetical protein